MEELFMQIRNRFEPSVTKNPYQKFSPSPLSKVPEEFKPALEDFIRNLPEDASFESRRNSVNYMSDLYTQHGHIIKQFAEQPEQFQQCLNQLEMLLKNPTQDAAQQFMSTFDTNTSEKVKKSTPYNPPEFLMSLLKQLGISAASSYSPYLGIATLLLSNAVPAAASYVSNTGIPAGGKDLCDGIMYCLQGYLTDGNGTLVSQLNRVVQQANGGKASVGTLWQLTDCMTFNKASDALTSVLSQNPGGNVTSDCVAISSQWQGYEVTSKVTKITTEACAAFQNNFESTSQSCMNTGRAIGLDIATTFIIIGGIAAIAGIAVGVCCLTGKLNHSHCKPKCCS
jgi:hypothetical protein